MSNGCMKHHVHCFHINEDDCIHYSLIDLRRHFEAEVKKFNDSKSLLTSTTVASSG